MRKLYWFQQDLRLCDNPGVLAQADASDLLCVYIWPKNRPWCNITGMGPQRERFLLESLQALRDELQALGQDIMVLHGSPEMVLPDLVRDYSIEQVATGVAPGYHERMAIQTLRRRLSVPLTLHDTSTLFDQQQLPFELASLPAQFTPFRRALESARLAGTSGYPDALPPPPAAPFDAIPSAAAAPHTALPIRGGSQAAHRTSM